MARDGCFLTSVNVCSRSSYAHTPIRPYAHTPIRPFAHSPIRPAYDPYFVLSQTASRRPRPWRGRHEGLRAHWRHACDGRARDRSVALRRHEHRCDARRGARGRHADRRAEQARCIASAARSLSVESFRHAALNVALAPRVPQVVTPRTAEDRVAGGSLTGMRAGVHRQETVRPLIPNAAATNPHLGQSRAMMVVGAAALIAGAIIGGDPGTIIMVGGAVIGLYGLYQYLQ